MDPISLSNAAGCGSTDHAEQVQGNEGKLCNFRAFIAVTVLEIVSNKLVKSVLASQNYILQKDIYRSITKG